MPNPPPRMRVQGPEFIALVATCMAMAALSIDVLLPAFPHMREDFGLPSDSTEVSRAITAFFLGLALGQLVYGPLSDRFGRKRLLYCGLAVYVLGAAASTQTESLGALVACRFVWGVGAAAPRSLALAMIRDTYEAERMARAMSHVMATFIVVPAVAPAIGALAMEVAPWRIVLWLPVVAAVVLVAWTVRLPETLPPERRRSVSPRALGDAAVAVARSRRTVAFTVAATCLFGIMTSYIGSSQVIFEDVFDRGDEFPFIFGAIAVMFGAGSLLSARLVVQLGIDGLVRRGSAYLVVATTLMVVVAVATDGEPPLWAFLLLTAITLPGVTLLVPNCNTAAMTPLPHVAGMAAALIGTISTAGGSLLGSVIDAAFDGTMLPWAVGAFVLSLLATSVIWLGSSLPGAAPALLEPPVDQEALALETG